MSREHLVEGILRRRTSGDPTWAIELADLLLGLDLTAQAQEILRKYSIVAVQRCAHHTDEDKHVFVDIIQRSADAALGEQELLELALFAWLYRGRDACNLIANKAVALTVQGLSGSVSKLALAALILEVDEVVGSEGSALIEALIGLLRCAGLRG